MSPCVTAANIPSEPPRLEISDPKKAAQYQECVKGIKLSKETMLKIGKIFHDEMELGLSLDPPKKSSLQMCNTYITQLPDGTEEGEFLALDLGGTNFRVLLLELSKGQLIREEVKHYHVPEALRLGHGITLFDYLAKCIHEFIQEHNLEKRRIPLGFTFSFPMDQRGLDSGVLVTWTKTFNCEGVVGEDAVKMLNDAIHRRGDLNVEVIAILNDTTGTLIQGAYLDQSCGIGLILGTGSNACYIEKAEKVLRWDGGKADGTEEVIVDIESGAFGDTGVLDFIRTEFDKELDRHSLLPESFTFEKYISGRYLGELARLIMVKLVKQRTLFAGVPSEKLLAVGGFTTRFISMIEADTISHSTDNVRIVLDEIEVNFDADDINIVKDICYLVTDRSAKLVAITLATILERMNKSSSVTIAVDGSLYKLHPRLSTLIDKYIQEFAPARKFSLLLAEDGSGKGSGLVAALAIKMKNKL